MPPQLKRLLPLFIIFVGLFLIVRHFLVPPSFGEYGHYRGASVKENTEYPLNYGGKKACVECHEDMGDTLASDVHTILTCEVCHGPGEAHISNPDSAKFVKPSGREFCGRCHTVLPGRNTDVIKQVDLKEHYPEQDCKECHNPHKPWELKNM